MIEVTMRVCEGVSVVLAPRDVEDDASARRAVLDPAPPEAPPGFFCGWHIGRDGWDRSGWTIRAIARFGTPFLRALRLVDIDDQVRAAERIFASAITGRGAYVGEEPMD